MRAIKLWIGALFCLSLPAFGQAHVDASVGYQLQRSNGPSGDCSCFNLQGGRGDLSYQALRSIAFVGEVSGGHASNINGMGLDLSLVTYLIGPRYSVRIGHHAKPFAQFLVGRVHGFDSTFPHPGAAFPAANSFALSAGGGMDYRLSRHLAVRLFQVDYLKSYLPNNGSNEQNSLRVGGGITFRWQHLTQ